MAVMSVEYAQKTKLEKKIVLLLQIKHYDH